MRINLEFSDEEIADLDSIRGKLSREFVIWGFVFDGIRRQTGKITDSPVAAEIEIEFLRRRCDEIEKDGAAWKKHADWLMQISERISGFLPPEERDFLKDNVTEIRSKTV